MTDRGRGPCVYAVHDVSEAGNDMARDMNRFLVFNVYVVLSLSSHAPSLCGPGTGTVCMCEHCERGQKGTESALIHRWQNEGEQKPHRVRTRKTDHGVVTVVIVRETFIDCACKTVKRKTKRAT